LQRFESEIGIDDFQSKPGMLSTGMAPVNILNTHAVSSTQNLIRCQKLVSALGGYVIYSEILTLEQQRRRNKGMKIIDE